MTTDIAPNISKAYLLSQGYKNGAFAYAIEVHELLVAKAIEFPRHQLRWCPLL